jgi:hypothetical protein
MRRSDPCCTWAQGSASMFSNALDAGGVPPVASSLSAQPALRPTTIPCACCCFCCRPTSDAAKGAAFPPRGASCRSGGASMDVPVTTTGPGNRASRGSSTAGVVIADDPTRPSLTSSAAANLKPSRAPSDPVPVPAGPPVPLQPPPSLRWGPTFRSSSGSDSCKRGRDASCGAGCGCGRSSSC